MQLTLIRHGQTTANAAKILDTKAPGAILTDLGHEQAAALVDQLAERPVDSIWVSNLTRTHQTAEPLAKARGLELNMRSGLREVEAGVLEGLDTQEAYAAYARSVFQWLDGNLDVPMAAPTGVTGKECLERFDEVVAEIFHTGQEHPVIFAHGTILTFWVAMRAAGATRELLENHPTNGGIILVDGEPGDFTLRSWLGMLP